MSLNWVGKKEKKGREKRRKRVSGRRQVVESFSSCSLHGNGVVEQYERRNFIAIQASLMNFITFDHYQWVAGSRDVACGRGRRRRLSEGGNIVDPLLARRLMARRRKTNLNATKRLCEN
jgi:hypothetical protein